ncbi:hypothetical protein ACHAW5_000326 [Stephanodiscus triporus]|uniref:Cellulase n=1 Tax=Stephanodiscus triporus TaxID=2934178 RepID=A0ABD3MPE0_9STRA
MRGMFLAIVVSAASSTTTVSAKDAAVVGVRPRAAVDAMTSPSAAGGRRRRREAAHHGGESDNRHRRRGASGDAVASVALHVKSPVSSKSSSSSSSNPPTPATSPHENKHASKGGKSSKAKTSKAPLVAVATASPSPSSPVSAAEDRSPSSRPSSTSSDPLLDPLPPLVWLGPSGCTPDSPCPACAGDCDSDDDCDVGLVCYMRTALMPTTVPGCAVGGPGEVDGADYCHDPNRGTSVAPSAAPVGPSPPPPSSSSSSSSLLPYLTWRGVDGCTPTSPCEPCQGDCDSDSDCLSGASITSASPPDGSGSVVTQYTSACFKRVDGSSVRVPGCEVGGAGDVPGADYCYAMVRMDLTYHDDDGTTSTSGPEADEVATTTPPPTPTTVDDDAGTTESPNDGTGDGGDEGARAYFIRSRARRATGGEGGGANVAPNGTTTTTVMTTTAITRLANDGADGWCIGGALSPDYYQLLMEECTPDYDTGANGFSHDAYVMTRMEQMDQLWFMDGMGHVRSSFDHGRCMTVSSSHVGGGVVAEEAPVEIGPCAGADSSSRFYYDDIGLLRLRGHEDYCVTFLGGDAPTRGSSVILDPCPAVAAATAGRGGEGKYGWDLVPERDLVESAATDSPVASPARGPQLQYLGRDACSTLTPCQECVGDCDSDDDCSIGLSCFERERGDVLQVPGCGTGGPGDIPGADYCYDPSSDDDDDDDGDTTSVTPSTSAPPSLRWLGSEGCTPTRPCGACSGDCDEDDDCLDGHECFKRLVGDFSPVPGCGVGGPGDIPGGDYCFDSTAALGSAKSLPDQLVLHRHHLRLLCLRLP